MTKPERDAVAQTTREVLELENWARMEAIRWGGQPHEKLVAIAETLARYRSAVLRTPQ